MSRARFRPNPRLERDLLNERKLVDALRETADDVAEEARRIARAEAYDEGDYHDGIEADAGLEGGRALGRVNANDWKSGLIEFGTGQDDTVRAPLRRAGDAKLGRVRGKEG